jgi:hypothetical protein
MKRVILRKEARLMKKIRLGQRRRKIMMVCCSSCCCVYVSSIYFVVVSFFLGNPPEAPEVVAPVDPILHGLMREVIAVLTKVQFTVEGGNREVQALAAAFSRTQGGTSPAVGRAFTTPPSVVKKVPYPAAMWQPEGFA